MGITVLLADDHAVVREGLESLLSAQPDIQLVGTAADGREAIRQASQLHPDVIVMDITMPGLNGIDAAEQIRAALPQTQVVFLSMHATRDHVFRALKTGALGYLLKETAGIEVADAVRAVAAGRRYLSEKVANLVIDDYVDVRKQENNMGPLEKLSPREREILQLVVEGKSSSEIAETLSLSASTVDTYRSRLMDKLGVKDLPGLVKFAIQQGLISLE